jgi:thiol:disulfide interchange protein DsbC
MRRIAPYISLSLIILLSCANSATSVKELPEKELDEQRAELALKALDPKIQVLSVKPTPIEGLFEVVAQSNNKKGIIYLDSKGENAFFGSIVEVATKTNITKLSIDEINKVDFSSIPLEDALVMGDPDAPYKVVVLDDPD